MSEEHNLDQDFQAEVSPIKPLYQENHHQNNEQFDDDGILNYRNPQGETPMRPDTQIPGKRKNNHTTSQPPIQVNPILAQSDIEQQENDLYPMKNQKEQSNGQKQNQFTFDELTEYAMAREGISHEDILEKPYEEILKECNGNVKLAQLRYEFKEAERQSLMQDIENRKRLIQMEMQYDRDQQYTSNGNNKFLTASTGQFTPQKAMYSTQQQPFMASRMSKNSQSHSQLPLGALNKQQKGSDEVDNKIFKNMLKNQIEQEKKARTIRERQQQFEQKAQQLQDQKVKQIQEKQEILQRQNQLKEERLRLQEIRFKQTQEDIMKKMKMKSETSEQRQLRLKFEIKQKLHEKESEHVKKRFYATQMWQDQQKKLERKQKEVQDQSAKFHQKQENKMKQMQEYIEQKKVKKEQVLRSVQEQKLIEDQKRIQKFLEGQMTEQQKEERLHQKKQEMKQKKRKEQEQKNEKMQAIVEQAYTKMEQWTRELEKREQNAAENLKRQQHILQEELALKREQLRLKQESAQLKQKRKEVKEKLKKDELVQKFETISQKIDNYKYEKTLNKQQKQQKLFMAEQKRAEMRTAFYHMAVWNVQEAGDIINEILEDNEMGAGKSAMNIHKVKPVSVAEKIRKKAAQMRKNERLGLHPKNGNEIVFEEISNTDVQSNHDVNSRQGSVEKHSSNRKQSQSSERGDQDSHKRNQNHNQPQKVVYDERQGHSNNNNHQSNNQNHSPQEEIPFDE